MHVRRAIVLSGDGDQAVGHDTPQTDPNPALELSSHAELVGARRHYSRYGLLRNRCRDLTVGITSTDGKTIKAALLSFT